MATGPAEPFASDKPHWEEDIPSSASADKEALEIGRAVHLARSRSRPWSLRHMMYLIAAVAVLLWLVMLARDTPALASLLVMAGFVLSFASVMGGGVILARRRSTRQDSLLSVLAIAAERGMPLAPALVAFADQFRGGSYRRIMDLASQIIWGASLPEALDRSRKLVSGDAVLLSWIGQAAGRLPRALRMAATTRSTQLPIWTAITARLSYILVLLLVLQSIGTFILYFIMPKFEAIFKDFGVGLPSVTIMVVEISHFLLRYGVITFFIPLFELALLAFLPFSFLAWGNFTVPFFDRLLGRRHTSLVLRALAITVEGGKPIALGLSTLSNHYPARWIRRRLLAAETDVEHGADWIASLRRHRLIRSTDADVLTSAAEVGNLAWALRELADTADRRLAVRFQVVIETLFPLVVVFLGMAVFIMATAYFVPLVSLITELTRQ